MHPKIVPSFWSDLDFNQFEGADLAAVRLTWVWAITSPTTNAAGIFPANPRLFTSDTGLDFAWLDRTMNAFPRSFTNDPASRHVLLHGYVRLQIAEGDKLAANWRMCGKVLADLRRSPLALARRVMALYPELRRATDTKGKPLVSPAEALAQPLVSPAEALAQPLVSPAEALAQGLLSENVVADTSPLPPQPSSHQPFSLSPARVPHGTKEGVPLRAYAGLGKPPAQTEREKEAPAPAQEGCGEPLQVGSSEVLIPSLAEVLDYGARIGVEPAACEAFHAYHESRGWMSGRTPLRKPLSLLAGYAAERRTVKKPGSSRRLDEEGPDADTLRARLQTEKRPAERTRLEQQIAALKA